MMTVSNTEDSPMDYSSHLHKLVLHTLPLIIGGSIAVGASFGNAVIITGISSEAVAANAYISSIKNVLIYPPRSIFFALQPLLGKAFQEKNYASIGKYWQHSMLLGLELSILLSIPLLNMSFILKKAHQNEQLADITGHYLYFYAAAVPANIGIEITNELFITTNNEYLLIPSSLLRTGLELGLNLFFIKYLKMGILGWEVSTLLQPLLSCMTLLLYIAHSKKFEELQLFAIKNNDPTYRQILSAIYQKQKEILQLGAPICLQAFVAFSAYFIDILMLGKMDEKGMVAFNACNQWSSWTINILSALSTSACVLISQHNGSNKVLDAKKMGETAIILGAVLSLTYLMISSLAYKPMTAVLLHSDDNKEPILSSAKNLMPIVGVCTLGFGLKFITAGAMRGYQKTKTPMLADVSGTILGLGLSAVLGFIGKKGAIGIATGEALGLMIASMLLLGYFSKKTGMSHQYCSMFNRVHHVFERLPAKDKDVVPLHDDSLDISTAGYSPMHIDEELAETNHSGNLIL